MSPMIEPTPEQRIAEFVRAPDPCAEEVHPPPRACTWSGCETPTTVRLWWAIGANPSSDYCDEHGAVIQARCAKPLSPLQIDRVERLDA